MNLNDLAQANTRTTRARKTVLISPESHRHLLNVLGKLHGRRCELNLTLDPDRQLPELHLGELLDLLIQQAADKQSDPLVEALTRAPTLTGTAGQSRQSLE